MKKIKFEDALSRLEEIVSCFEGEELSLEKSLKLFEEGVKLSKYCQDKLDEASKKIEILTKFHEDGSLKKESFEFPED